MSLGQLFFWQQALSDLRDNFFPFSVKPKELPQHEVVSYAPEHLELNWHKVHLKDRTGRYLPFLLSLVRDQVPFCVLTRYLVFNSISGMMHLYHFRQSDSSKNQEKLYAQWMENPPKFKRGDTRLYLHHYIERALQTIGEAR